MRIRHAVAKQQLLRIQDLTEVATLLLFNFPCDSDSSPETINFNIFKILYSLETRYLATGCTPQSSTFMPQQGIPCYPLNSFATGCSLQQDAHPVFQQAACYGKAVAVKAAAIEALAITAFVASNDPDVVDKCMTGFANLWKAGVLLLVIFVLDSYCPMMHCYVCNL